MENKRVEEYSTSRPPQTGKIWKDFSHLWNGWCQSTENAELILFQKKINLGVSFTEIFKFPLDYHS